MAGAVLALAGTVFLIVKAHRNPWELVSFGIYGATLVVLFTSSALYHSVRAGRRVEQALYGLDRAAIYALIAGTYTPICLIALPAGWGWSLFGIVWGLAIAGIVADAISRRRAPDWLQGLFYLVVGWVAVVAIRPLLTSLPAAALGWLIAGAVIYSIGAVICVTDRPKLRPGVFSAHEIWHLFVIAGSVCHFCLMACLARAF
jgi:hemolysin III